MKERKKCFEFNKISSRVGGRDATFARVYQSVCLSLRFTAKNLFFRIGRFYAVFYGPNGIPGKESMPDAAIRIIKEFAIL